MLNIAVVLFETSNGQLRGNVVSEEGPTALLAARPHNAMANAAREAAQNMVDNGPHSEARVWQLQTTEADATNMDRRFDTAALVRHVRKYADRSEVLTSR
ncbi:hypothetical protein [Amycolatopsis magusensis]|uniref:hypothetical protein n=1 Tax=Amycolatopsis magusensis TaxID=882444 RepID=UPI0024A81314|nr:hypothetical protein [Amycolatopsis magusensis]MDI5980108.1 hypothetical protein [Amycolatopsis magusensis]